MRPVVMSLVVFLSLALAGCEKARPPVVAEPKRYEVRGIVRGIGFADRELTVEHEEIPGYMPAMTMPFAVKEMKSVEALRAGDGIGFQLVVTDKDSWIEGVRPIDPASVRLSQTRAEAGPSGNTQRLKEGDSLPPFHLVDSTKRGITRETFAGKPLLLTFIFTRCPLPNFCPLMINNFRQIEQAVSREPALAPNLQFLSISFDSEFDTPDVLARYAKLHAQDSDRWCFATGTAAETTRLTQAFSVHVQPESGTIAHGLCTVLVSSNGTIRKLWRGNAWKPEEVVAALREPEISEKTVGP